MDRSLSGPANNFSEQFLYGHREILIAYAGVKAGMALRGSIEHGWSPFGPNLGVPRRPGKRYIHLAWSSRNLNRFNHKYPSSVIPIGAPFLYLYRLLLEHKSLNLANNRKFLFVPPHGGEADTPEIKHIIDIYSSRFNPMDTTVQLYWTEFLKTEVRDAYLSKGFHVVTAGYSGHSATEGLGMAFRERAMSTMGDRHLFLLRVMLNLLNHNEIIFGGFGTSTLYAGFLEKKITLLPNWDTLNWKNTDNALTQTDTDYNNFIKKEIIPYFFDINLKARPSFKEFCQIELGYSNLLTKTELAQLIHDNHFLIRSDASVNEFLSVINEEID